MSGVLNLGCPSGEGFHARRGRHERDQQDFRRHRRHGRPPGAGGHPARHVQGPGAAAAQRQDRDHRGRRDADRRMARGAARPDPRRPVGMRAAASQRLSFLPLLAVVFFNVSGGPYGIEDAVSVFGPGLTLLLLALTPLLVSTPIALAMAEMASALPEEGGYVAWVPRPGGPAPPLRPPPRRPGPTCGPRALVALRRAGAGALERARRRDRGHDVE